VTPAATTIRLVVAVSAAVSAEVHLVGIAIRGGVAAAHGGNSSLAVMLELTLANDNLFNCSELP
jgi:hypothetical protein